MTKSIFWSLSIKLFCLSAIVRVSGHNIESLQDILNANNLKSKNPFAPKSVDKKVQIFMYTTEHPEETEVKVGDKEALDAGGFDSKLPVFFCIHGFLNNRTSPTCSDIKDELLKKGGLNVFIVDWGQIVLKENYINAAGSVEQVGKTAALFVNYLMEEGVQSKMITLVGHSLGCHVSGNVGRNSKEKLARIVGLDCAGPGFGGTVPGPYAPVMIRKSDAKSVETWISNGMVFGMPYGVGHITCYLNNGSDQPGCSEEESNQMMSAACSHGRAPKTFAESIANGGAPAKLCKNVLEVQSQKCDGPEALMGGTELQKTKHGIYNMMTNSQRPFLKK